MAHNVKATGAPTAVAVLPSNVAGITSGASTRQLFHVAIEDAFNKLDQSDRRSQFKVKGCRIKYRPEQYDRRGHNVLGEKVEVRLKVEMEVFGDSQN